MKRLIQGAVLGLAILLIPGLAWAQQGTITGTVTEAETGDPLPGATVQVVDEGIGAASDAEGRYRMTGVPAGEQTLRVSFVGYQTTERTVNVPAGGTVRANFQLQTTEAELEEVVVTALGFEENRDQLGAAQSTIEGADIAESAETSVLKSLSAQATGLNVTSFGGDPGAGARIVIRGATTIQGDNQPLIVIDGVPVSNQTFEQGVGGVQQQSRLNDLNPSNIESVEVLKGASAAALWGSRAQSGVLLIETKQGQYGGAKTNVSFESSIRIDNQNQSQDLQEEYGQGFGGVYIQGFGDASFLANTSWGDRIADREGGSDDVLDGPNDPVAVGQQTGNEYRLIEEASVNDYILDFFTGRPVDIHGGKNSKDTYDHSTRLFETGAKFENSLSVSGGGQEGRYFLSLSNVTQNGIIPENSNYERTNIRLNASRQVTESFSVQANASYVKTNSDRVQQGSNISGLLLGAYRTPADFDNTDYLVDYYPSGTDGPVVEGRQRAYRAHLGSTSGPGYDNPLFTYNQNVNHSIVNRIQGKVEANYNPLNWLRFTGRVGVDNYTDRRNAYFAQHNSSNPDGAQEEQTISEFRINTDFIARATRDLTDDIGSSLTLGFNFNHQEYDELDADLNSFTNPERFRSLGNAAAENVSAFLDQSTERTASVYGELKFDLYDQLFITGTGRIDQSSTFGPEADASFFYPSVQVAWQFSDVLPESDILSFGKLRASVGQVGRQPSPYQAFTYFNPGSYFDGFTGTTLSASGYGGGFERGNNLGNPVIEPEKTTEYEGGVDLRFFDDRVRFSGTYYFKKSTNLIFSVDVPASTGFTSRTDNVAEIENEGIELQLGADLITGDNFQWTTDARWWTNENTVTDLQGVESVFLDGFVSTSSRLVEGEPFGTLWGSRWRRASFEPLSQAEKDRGLTVGDNGRILNPDGFPVEASQNGVLGDPNPDWNLGLTNTFTFKGLTLDAVVDYVHGGDVWNGTKGALSFFGRHGTQDWFTTISADKATNQNITTYNGCTVAQLASNQCITGGAFGLPGTANARQNDDGTYSFRGYVKDFGAGEKLITESYFLSGPGSGFTGPGEQFIEDGGHLRLQRVSLSYNWDSQTVQNIGLSSINISATARNLLLITDYSGIDPETNLTGPSNGQGLDYFNNPNTRSYQFTLRFNY